MNNRNNLWKEAFQRRGFIFQLIFFTTSILIVVSFLPYFFHSVIGPKPGITINDSLLNSFTPQDNSWVIFGLIYLSLVIVVQGVMMKPQLVLLGLKCYLSLTILRMISMYLFTLEPPPGIIPLQDPIVDVIAYGGNVFNKDLFFSGHVATLTLFAMLEERPFPKKVLMVSTSLVAVFVLLQRVHYTVDVMAAPAITFFIVKLIRWLSVTSPNRGMV